MSLVSWRTTEVEIKQYPNVCDWVLSANLEGYLTADAYKHSVPTFDIKRELDDKLMCGVYSVTRVLPEVKRVIFNSPATIIFWTDNTKSVVKCQEGDVFDAEKGFVMAYLKKLMGNGNKFNKEINKWVNYEH